VHRPQISFPLIPSQCSSARTHLNQPNLSIPTTPSLPSIPPLLSLPNFGFKPSSSILVGLSSSIDAVDLGCSAGRGERDDHVGWRKAKGEAREVKREKELQEEEKVSRLMNWNATAGCAPYSSCSSNEGRQRRGAKTQVSERGFAGGEVQKAGRGLLYEGETSIAE
jgi:hypothetical protein